MKIKKLNESLIEETQIEETSVDTEDIAEGLITEAEEIDGGAVKFGDDGEPLPKFEMKIKNKLTDLLDEALADAEDALDEGNYGANCNVLVTGLPGSSKTQTVKQWAKDHGCNIFYLDAKNPDIQLLISGGSAIDRTNPEEFKMKAAYSDALAKLDRERSVLFLDELNRQLKEYLRGSLLTLVADREVAGPGESGTRQFKNLLFTVACVNPPAGDKDKGASKLNDAEKRRFYYQITFDSEKATTTEYFIKYYDWKLKTIAREKDTNPKFAERVKKYLYAQWIGNKIVNHPEFSYSTLADYETSHETDTKIMCQSILTELVDKCGGDLEKLKRHVTSVINVVPSAQEMLLKIINTIVLPDYDALRAKKERELGIDLGGKDSVKPMEDETPVKKTTTADEEEDALDFSGEDDDLDMKSSAGVDPDRMASARKSPIDVSRAISSFADSLL